MLISMTMTQSTAPYSGSARRLAIFGGAILLTGLLTSCDLIRTPAESVKHHKAASAGAYWADDMKSSKKELKKAIDVALDEKDIPKSCKLLLEIADACHNGMEDYGMEIICTEPLTAARDRALQMHLIPERDKLLVSIALKLAEYNNYLTAIEMVDSIDSPTQKAFVLATCAEQASPFEAGEILGKARGEAAKISNPEEQVEIDGIITHIERQIKQDIYTATHPAP